jgi:hypothetical protein
MKKRSAMTIAGGLVAAMLAGAVALSLGFASGQTSGTSAVRPEPRVRTIERTITIHKKAKPKPAVVQTIAAPAQAAPAAPARVSGTSTSDDVGGMSDDDGSDGRFEGEDHEDEFEGEDHDGEDDHESEDHEDEGGSEDD